VSRARYAIVSVKGGVVTIRDLNIGRSVTNDAEAVVEELVARWGDQRIMYYDSSGQLDELLHRGGQFTGFAPGPRRLPLDTLFPDGQDISDTALCRALDAEAG
jgi:hypothetical protein